MPDDGGQGVPGTDAPERGAAERQGLEGEFLLAMRRNGSITQLLGQVSAERIGINVTDLNCLNIVALAGPVTAGELAPATGLNTAAITRALDRLEDGGLLPREPRPQDPAPGVPRPKPRARVRADRP